MWVPETKADCLDALGSVYRDESAQRKLKRMSKKQLLAIFYYLRRTKRYFS